MEAMMNRETSAHAEQALAHLAYEFTHWRQHRRSPGERIPPPLWDQAVALTAVLPLSQVAKHLGLRRGDLHKRCAAQSSPNGASTTEGPARTVAFVELPASPVCHPVHPTVADPPRPTPRVEVELQRTDGTRLRLHYHEPPPLEAVVRVFLEARS
jgi:hypothetical protein